MKYNRSEIMKTAWNIVRTAKINISTALRTAWAAAKAEIEAKEIGETYAGTTKTSRNDWVKYGNNRTYIEAKVYTNGWNLKRVIKAGYIDNLTGEWVAA